MVQILKQGNLPKTPHTEFYSKDGVLSLEEIHGTYGFNGPYSRKNHLCSYPTEQSKPPKKVNFSIKPILHEEEILQPYLIHTGEMPFDGDYVTGRIPILLGDSTEVSVSKPKKNMNEKTFFKNGEKHELIYVQDGKGILKTEYGNLNLKKGFYFIIPKGTIYQIVLESESLYLLIIESKYPILFPPHYMNKEGQASLMSPIVETEIEIPEFQEPKDLREDFELLVKHSSGNLTCLTLSHHPFDLIGWEGSLYPFGFDINNHHGIAREIHTAPPMRQTFQSGDGNSYGFSICSFKAQMEGWHPRDIPAPYAHSNVDSDEVLFFSSSVYTAREGIVKEGSITLHPSSIPHSPHGDAALRSMKERAKVNTMLAVMLDTFFENLKITKQALKYKDENYSGSWYKVSKENLVKSR